MQNGLDDISPPPDKTYAELLRECRDSAEIAHAEYQAATRIFASQLQTHGRRFTSRGDRRLAIQQARIVESAALDKYMTALRVFTTMPVDAVLPGDPGCPSDLE